MKKQYILMRFFSGTKYNLLQLIFLLKHFDILVIVFLFDCVTV